MHQPLQSWTNNQSTFNIAINAAFLLCGLHVSVKQMVIAPKVCWFPAAYDYHHKHLLDTRWEYSMHSLRRVFEITIKPSSETNIM